MAEMFDAQPGRPGCRVLVGLRAATVRHFPGETAAQTAVMEAGLLWPSGPGEVTGDSTHLAWRGPQEVLAVGIDASAIQIVLDRLKPGGSATALAADWSDALTVFELHGPELDAWLARLMDSQAIPSGTGRASRGRLVDVPVMLLRLDARRMWLIVDRAITAHVSEWLRYAHDRAFDL